MKKLAVLFAVPILFLGAAVTGQAQDAIQFRYDWKENAKHIYQRGQTITQSQTVMDKKINTKITSTDVSVLTVEAKDAKGNLEIRTENKHLKVDMDIDIVGKYSFDSSKNDNEKGSTLGAALTPVYERLSGAALTLTVTPRGEVVDLKGYKELIADVLKGNPLGEQFAGGGSDKAAKLNLAEFFPQFPENAVKPGEIWETKFDMELPKLGKVQGKRIYTLDSLTRKNGRKLAKILVSTELSFDLDINMEGAKVTGNMSISKSGGTILYDVEENLIVSLNNQITLGGLLNVQAGGMNIQVGSEQNQSIDMKLLNEVPK
jgi:hypothetical protein